MSESSRIKLGLRRGLGLRCPQCGEGRLFGAHLSGLSACSDVTLVIGRRAKLFELDARLFKLILVADPDIRPRLADVDLGFDPLREQIIGKALGLLCVAEGADLSHVETLTPAE